MPAVPDRRVFPSKTRSRSGSQITTGRILFPTYCCSLRHFRSTRNSATIAANKNMNRRSEQVEHRLATLASNNVNRRFALLKCTFSLWNVRKSLVSYSIERIRQHSLVLICFCCFIWPGKGRWKVWHKMFERLCAEENVYVSKEWDRKWRPIIHVAR